MKSRGWLKRKRAAAANRNSHSAGLSRSRKAREISTSLEDNIAELHRIFTFTPDLVIRDFESHFIEGRIALVYLTGLVDKNSINNNVLRPLLAPTERGHTSILDLLSVGKVTTLHDFEDVEEAILQGSSLLFIEGREEALSVETHGWPQRAIEDPQLEASLKGAHQGFVETGIQNIALIRRYIPNRELKIKEVKVGKRGACKLSILFISDVMNPEILQELEDRIRLLDIDNILNTGELAELIEDNPYSPFPQLLTTERPDSAASHLLQGKTVIVVDRSPSVLVGPVSFASFFQNVDDYSTRWLVATFIRLLRFLAFLVATFLPAIYIAVISYNYEVIPLDLILSVGESRARVPFPPLLEAMMMELTLEMLREAGVRLPAPIGQTVGIVGGIVIGQAVVQAGIVSNIMVIVVAFTAISSFIIPNYDMAAAVRLIRFLMMIMASMFGFIGIIIGLMTLIGHLISLESLGIPYGSPLAPVRFKDWKDLFLRVPLWKMMNRPVSARAIQAKRQGDNRPKEEGE
ncbi:spore germination protein [Brevibacillus reuszeri]|uniref:Spore gernimation protein n=1 Tax=Brevibacillus reuszeri TaxID=54915 RepID=A0A0K9YLX0_9BACL|nr:spore germination protein [Brevibacillus reuszeri]KNB69733.1 spore gernimation protein [Brevibacillus reuszeri]MED1858074.1 spore germination protein [Brevibacillus reuszeri]